MAASRAITSAAQEKPYQCKDEGGCGTLTANVRLCEADEVIW